MNNTVVYELNADELDVVAGGAIPVVAAAFIAGAKWGSGTALAVLGAVALYHK